MGAVTRGLIDRTAYYEHAVVCALAPFLHDDSGLYDAAAAAPPAPAPVPAPPAPARRLRRSHRPRRRRPRPARRRRDFELVAVLSPEQRSAESRKRAEREGDVIDLSDLADDDGRPRPRDCSRNASLVRVQEQHLQERRRISTT